jgi:site-specific recombinase XerD
LNERSLSRDKPPSARDIDNPHDMRRSFVSNPLTVGADIATVAKLAGHDSIDTTARYDRRQEDVKRKTSMLLHVPYQSRKNPPIAKTK